MVAGASREHERTGGNLQEDSVDEPDIVVPPSNPAAKTAQSTYNRKDPGNPQQSNMCHCAEYRMRDIVLTLVVCVLERLTVFERCKCAWYDQERGKDQPR